MEAVAADRRREANASWFAAEADRLARLCGEMAERFARGGRLLDTSAYKIDAGRREAPGEVEYHEHTVDVMHVVEGAATVVLGGEMHDVREVGPGELRAASVEGGDARDLRAGDVLAIPNGVPHQFVDVSAPFLYFVVKVAA